MKQRDIIVSLWSSDSTDDGSYLGCGVCIGKRDILTAKHVIESVAENQIYVGAIPRGDTTIPIEGCQKHENRDLAILILVKAHGKEIIFCDSTTAIEAGDEVQLLAYNKTARNTKGPIKLEITNWTQPNGWEFHTKPVEGMSGGAVLLNDKLVGIIQAKEEEENSGIIIPLDAVSDFLKPYTTSSDTSSTKPNPIKDIPKEDGTFREKLAKHIARELRRPNAHSLLASLLEELGIEEKEPLKALPELADKLLDKPVDVGIRNYLTVATIDCILESGFRYADSRDNIPEIKRIAETIMGWLVLSSIDEEEIQTIIPEGIDTESLYFVLGHVSTSGGVELVLSRCFQRNPKLSGKEQLDQNSPNHIEIDPRFFADDADDANDPTSQIMVEIWNKVFDSPEEFKESGAKFSEDDIKILNATLRSRRMQKHDAEHYYLTFNTSSCQEDQVRKIYRELLANDKLYQMTVVEIGSKKGSKTLIMDEVEVIAEINSFYRAINPQEAKQEHGTK